MKKVLFLVGIFNTICALAQSDSLTEKSIKDEALKDVQVSYAKKSSDLDVTITKLDLRVTELDKSIKDSRDAKDKADKLLLRVQALEDKAEAVDQNELNIYQANYSSAVINLVSMEREIRPLILFNTTKDFFSNLNDMSNPMNYEGYRQWFAGFKAHIEGNKDKNAQLNVLSKLLNFTGDMTKGITLAGPVASALFVGIADYIGTLGNRQKDLRDKSEQMFALTMTLAQFTHDKNLIELEWESITKELEDIKKNYDATLSRNLDNLAITKGDFDRDFAKESDANNRRIYLNSLSEKTAMLVTNSKAKNKNWKEIFYYQMTDVQTLKLRFGAVTFKISENISKYNELINKYRTDRLIGTKMQILETKLSGMKDAFDKAFEPLEYVNSANKMYKVH